MPYQITDDCTGCRACTRICPADAIHGEKREKHLIDAVRCIECGACGRVCPEASVKDPYGRSCVMVKRSAWKKPVLEKDRCCSCGICIDTCPVGCLFFSPGNGGGGHPYPSLTEVDVCIACGFCAKDCPAGALTMI